MKQIFTLTLLLLAFPVIAQVRVGTDATAPVPSAMLEIDSPDRGFLLPRLADPDQIANPVNGLQVFNTTTNCLQIFISPGGWQNIYCGSSCGGAFTDSRDSQEYSTVQIGNQCWMAENLNYVAANSWCYEDNSSNCATYGRLYTWEGALSACPSGWHLPSDAEWTILTDYLGGEDLAGGKMKSTSGWNPPNTAATNESGFSGVPGGFRNEDGSFDGIGNVGYWWSSTEYDADDAWSRDLGYNYDYAYRDRYWKTDWISCRCLRD